MTCTRRHREGADADVVYLDCACCVAGKPCVGVLQLNAQQQSQLDRIEALIGTSSQSWQRSTTSTSTARTKPADVEPTTRVECPACEHEYLIAEYLAAFLKQHRAAVPKCDECKAGPKAAIRGAA